MTKLTNLIRSSTCRAALAGVITGITLAAAAPAQATHFRYGNLTWEPTTPARTIIFHLANAWRRDNNPSFNPCINVNTNAVTACSGGDGFALPGDVIREDIGGTRLAFGDGQFAGSPGNSAGPLYYLVTSVDVANNWLYGLAIDPNKSLPLKNTDIAHTYAGNTASFAAEVNDCCRISAAVAPNAHINNPDKGYTLGTTVTFGNNTCPVSTQVPIVNCVYPGICNFGVPASDTNGDTLHYRLATSTEANRQNLLNSSTDNVNGVFRQPGPPNAPNAASVAPNTGVYTWNTTGATIGPVGYNTLYSTQVIVEDLTGPGGSVKCQTPVDFLIQLVPPVNHPPVCNVTSPQNVIAGNNLSFGVSASDPDGGDTVTLNGVGIPAGATMTPGLPTAGNPVSSTFSWTPGISDVGSVVVQYSATDQTNQQVLCPVTINVLCNAALCNDNNPCTNDVCSMNTCMHPPNTASCDDGNGCTLNDVCSGGSCQPGTPKSCDDSNVCTDDSCSAPSGTCVNTNNTNPCSDGNGCTLIDVCSGGSCQPGAPKSCDDSNVCTNDSCSAPSGTCINANNTNPCSDGNGCTLIDVCSGGSCQPGAPKSCDDSNICTNDSCSAPSGTCVNTNNTAPCSDGNGCTLNDVCGGGSCQAGTPKSCSDNNACTDDSCSAPSGTCVNTNNTASCDDGDGCTVNDVCGGGSCTPGGPKDCSDNNVCTDDTCKSPSGTCQHANNTASCTDGDGCTLGDVCDHGDCVPGAPKNCADTNACTDDLCSSPSGTCTHPPNSAPCDDGNPCTTPDQCTGGSCGGTPYDCNDNLPCTIDSCNGAGGSPLCVYDNCYDLPGTPCPPNHPECIPIVCGNGHVDSSVGETCDPPDPTLGPNGQPKCRPDCTSCGDGVIQANNSETCDDGNLVSGCDPQMPQKPLDDCLNSCRSLICEDPAKIKLSTTPNQIKVHGRMIANSAVDFTGQHYVIQLTQGQTDNVVYRASLLKGAIQQWSPSTISYRNKGAKKTGGIYILKIQARTGYYKFVLTAYGNASTAVSDMTTHVFVGKRQWVVRGLWQQLARGWVLNKKGTFLEP